MVSGTAGRQRRLLEGRRHQRRAAAARDYLVSLGIDGGRMETVSYGKERPLDARANEEAWSVNRNAHTQIVSGAVS